MPQIDVLATLPRTRRGILLLVKQRVRVTIAELAQQLEMTHEGVRSHILQLQQDGWIAIDPTAEGDRSEQSSGRPASRYRLTVAGEHAFPKRYDALSALVLKAVMSMTDRAGLQELLATVTDLRFEALPRLGGAGTPRIESMYATEDPFVESVERDGDLVLVERNCPFLQVALDDPTICSTSVSLIRRVTGCEVVRERRFQDGDGRCEFRVLRNRPIGDPPRFAPEPSKDAFPVQ